MIHQGIWPLVSAREMQALDRYTIEAIGIPGEILMESAGRSVVDAVLERLPPAGKVLVVCGAGNNGGDGFVVARHLSDLKVPVSVVMPSEASRLQGDAALNFERLQRKAISVEERFPAHGSFDVVVDALFGTGLTREVTGAFQDAIEWINASREAGSGVISVDLPSGLNADTGQVLGSAVGADVTVTISLPKVGLMLEPGRSLAGQVQVARVGIADEAPEAKPEIFLWNSAAAGGILPKRSPQGHKGSFGHVLIVAGSEGKTGAAVLAADAAGRTGSGLVTIVCPAGVNSILEEKCTEAMTCPVEETADHHISSRAFDAIVALASERDVVALGPGLGVHPDTVELVQRLVVSIEKPMVIDADGLNALASCPEILKERRAVTIITPHPGEASRWLECDTRVLNQDRLAAARTLVERTGAIVVLKGAGTVIASPDQGAIVNPTGGPWLSTGGTGDVLTGVIAAFLAQGVSPVEAASLGAYLHGAAGDDFSRKRGVSGMLAGDLVPLLPETANRLRTAFAESQEIHPYHEGLRLSFP